MPEGVVNGSQWRIGNRAEPHPKWLPKLRPGGLFGRRLGATGPAEPLPAGPQISLLSGFTAAILWSAAARLPKAFGFLLVECGTGAPLRQEDHATKLSVKMILPLALFSPPGVLVMQVFRSG